MIKLKFKLKKTDEEDDENHTQVIAHYVWLLAIQQNFLKNDDK